jgi:hypothetical protein
MGSDQYLRTQADRKRDRGERAAPPPDARKDGCGPLCFDVLGAATYIGSHLKLLQAGMQAWNFEGFRDQHVHDWTGSSSTAVGRACKSSTSGELGIASSPPTARALGPRRVSLRYRSEGRRVACSIIDITASGAPALQKRVLLRSVIDAFGDISVRIFRGCYVLVNNAFAELATGRWTGSTAAQRRNSIRANICPMSRHKPGHRAASVPRSMKMMRTAARPRGSPPGAAADDAGNVKYVATVSVRITDRRSGAGTTAQRAKYRAIIEDQTSS